MGYVIFISNIKNHLAAGYTLTEAITKAIEECIDQGILASYLMSHGSEVLNMLTQEWDMGKALDVRFLEGKEEGREEGKDQEKIETARRMLLQGFILEQISISTGLSIDKIEALQ